MKVVIVSGICIEGDAISSAMASQAELLLDLAEVHDVVVIAQLVDRELPCRSFEVHTSWDLVTHRELADADLVIFHWGIYYTLFDAVTLLRDVTAVVCHFHNSTPEELVEERDRYTMQRSLQQLELVPWLGLPVWTFSDYNFNTLQELGVASTNTAFVPFVVQPAVELTPNRERGRVALAVVGRLVRAKGLHVLLQAIAPLPLAQRNILSLRIAGNADLSDPAYILELHELVASHDLGGLVKFVGQPSNTELWHLYAESDIVVCPSFHEGLCVPAIEAYLADCRVVATTAGNLQFLVQPPDESVPSDDVAALSDALQRSITLVLTEGAASPSAHRQRIVAAFSRANVLATLRTEALRAVRSQALKPRQTQPRPHSPAAHL